MGNESSSAVGGSSGGDGDQAKNGPGGGTEEARLRSIQRMDASLRRKLRAGVTYNMKIILRGERGSGKSALLNRLQGQGFTPEVSEKQSCNLEGLGQLTIMYGLEERSWTKPDDIDGINYLSHASSIA